MRSMLVAPLVVTALASCAAKTPPLFLFGQDLTIEIVLAMDNHKCVARLKDTGQKSAANAIGWTDHAVIWKVVANDCGEKKKVHGKALGLKSLKLKGTGNSAFWLKDCSDLACVPAGGGVEFKCPIPTSVDPRWKWSGDEQIYEYEIDGDEVDPGDPDVGIRRNG